MPTVSEIKHAAARLEAALKVLPPPTELKESARQATLARDSRRARDPLAFLSSLSPDVFRWQAEKEAAPAATRNAVYSLIEAVGALVVVTERSNTRIARLTVALVVLTLLPSASLFSLSSLPN